MFYLKLWIVVVKSVWSAPSSGSLLKLKCSPKPVKSACGLNVANFQARTSCFFWSDSFKTYLILPNNWQKIPLSWQIPTRSYKMYFNRCLLPHQRHHHTSQGRCQGLLGEHAKPDISFKEGGRAEAPGDVLQRGHAQVSGELDPQELEFDITKLRDTQQVWQTCSSVLRYRRTGSSRFLWI